MGCRKTFTGARLSAHPRVLPRTLTSRVSAGRGAAPTRAPPRPAGEDRARVTSWTVDDTVFWRIGTNASTGEKALGASTWYRLSFLAAKTEPGLRRRPEAPKPRRVCALWSRDPRPGPAPWARPALSGDPPFRPLTLSHSAEVRSRFGNSIVRGASCFGGFGRRLASGPLAASAEI